MDWNDKEKVRQYHIEYRKLHKEIFLISQKKYYKSHKNYYKNWHKLHDWEYKGKYKSKGKYSYEKSAENRDNRNFGGLRKKTLQRDNYSCVECGLNNEEHQKKWKRSITVDHIDGFGRYSKIKHNSMENLQTLCLSCHGKKDHRKKGVKNKMRKLALLAVLLTSASKSWALSWEDWIKDSEGNIVKFTALSSISPSYFYNAFSGRSEVGAATQIAWFGSFVSADVGYSVPNAQDRNEGTVILGGNLHINRLLSKTFPDTVQALKAAIPNSMEKFFGALNAGVYVGHSTAERELAGGIYSSLELKF